jgi:uncharacterized membrane protein HdeD (DUF308 family)
MERIMTINLNKKTLITEGILLIIVGLLAIWLPTFITMSIISLIGILAIIAGAVQLFRTFQNTKTNYFWSALISAGLAIIVGILLLSYPLHGAMVLALLLGIWFLFHGILEISFALQVRHHSRNWGVLLLSGIVSIVLAIIIWSGWPLNALWVVGLLLGINLIFFGVSLFAIAFRKKAAS